MKNFGIIILLVTLISCNSNVKKATSENDIIVYKNLDNTLLVLRPEMFFSKDHLLFDISMKYMDKYYYNAMSDTLNKYGVKQNNYIEPRPTYAFIAKNNDTLYTTNNMDEWWVIGNRKKEFIRDENRKTLKFLLRYSSFFLLYYCTLKRW